MEHERAELCFQMELPSLGSSEVELNIACIVSHLCYLLFT
jgi:hypothetical protein